MKKEISRRQFLKLGGCVVAAATIVPQLVPMEPIMPLAGAVADLESTSTTGLGGFLIPTEYLASVNRAARRTPIVVKPRKS